MRRFPRKTVTRALLYIRILAGLIKEGIDFVSSQQLAELTGLTDVQIRKDISNFGKIGTPRIGYGTRELKTKLEDFILQSVVHIVLFGVGNLGAAILKYPGFHQDKIKVVAAFDKDKNKIGKKINGIPVYSIQEAQHIIARKHIEIAIIAVPKEHSQEIADTIVAAGVRGIVNFSPTVINVPKGVFVKYIDLSIEFLSLFCDIQLQRKPCIHA